MSIQQLPEDVIAQIKSATTITSLDGVVCGLLKNSLDAEASKITVSIDYTRGSCSVEDDGLGIPPAEFSSHGGLCKLHYTSKFPAKEGLHGGQGTFLASLASLSLLSLTSHHYAHHSHNTIRVHNSAILARHLPSLPDQRLLSYPHGTRVTVRDLFGSMPVRVKRRAFDVERGATARHWEHLKRAIAALLLAWPKSVNVSIRDSVNQWHAAIRSTDEVREQAVVSLASCEAVQRIPKILYQAGVSNDNAQENWIPLRASAGRLSAVGSVSLLPVATRRLQFISIGVRPLSNEHGSNVLYEEINRLFANSGFGVEEKDLSIDEDERRRQEQDLRYKSDGFTNLELKGRKGVDRWPMFYIRIDTAEDASARTPLDVEDLLDERHGSLHSVLELLRAVFYAFLKKNHYRPKHIQSLRSKKASRPGARDPSSRKTSRGATPTDKSSSREPLPMQQGDRRSRGDLADTRLLFTSETTLGRHLESPFDAWTKVKSGHAQQTLAVPRRSTDQRISVDDVGQLTGHLPSDPSDAQYSGNPLIAPDGGLLRAPFNDVDEAPHMTSRSSPSKGLVIQSPLEQGGDELIYTNPITKEKSFVNARTGFIIQPLDNRVRGTELEAKTSQPISTKRMRTQSKPRSIGSRSPWLNELLSSWENPVYRTTEPPIPAVFDETQVLTMLSKKGGAGPCCTTGYAEMTESLPSVQGRLSRQTLRSAEVIAQVDRKFIVMKVPLVAAEAQVKASEDSPAVALVAVDQHAADERCRVEGLMKDYFATTDIGITYDQQQGEATKCRTTVRAQTEMPDKPLQFDVSAHDASQLRRCSEFFGYWGVVYEVVSKSRSWQVRITGLPPSILERCQQEPRLLIELLRKEAWRLEEHDSAGGQKAQSHREDLGGLEESNQHWLARFHGCPEGIVNMLNSRACRSAIMFNDSLSPEDCRELLDRLADTALPFQCAHGRPSMVPLVDLGGGLIATSKADEDSESYGKRFKQWRAGKAKDAA
ncbi:hypothetical protein F4780DRAFT_766144 [Xylariomycetidae sp. FL0641]|nr:hypothetical protein F4780DRAFT_766144 [Xylariomycetidae sp. FL0641]